MTFTHIGQNGLTRAAESLNGVGGKHGATGLSMSAQDSGEIAAYLAKHSPADMDKAAASRALSHGVKLNVRLEGRYPANAPSYDVATGCDIEGTTAQREAARADLVNFMTPPTVRKIEHWLGELSVLTAGRSRDGVDAELMISAYSGRLARFPADVVHFALIDTTWMWFPSWMELEKVCIAKEGPRRHMIAALSKPEPDREPDRRPPTQAERDRIQAMVDELFPLKPRAEREAAVDVALQGNCMKGDAA